MAEVEFTTEELASEEWRPVVRFEGRYEVSSLGRIRSLMAQWRRLRDTPLMLRRTTHKRSGYVRVTMGTRKTRSVHIVVAEAFLGLRPASTDGYRIEVNHKDGVKANCRETNLEWISQLANLHHAAEHGLQRHVSATGDRHGSKTHPECVPIGSRHGHAKLNESTVSEILRRLSVGAVQRDVAREFGVSVMAISLIKSGKTWRHVTRPE